MKKYNGKELYKGLLFIKSMMSMNNVNRQKELDQTYALSVGIECDQTVVDDGASTSVDRPQMRQLMEILEISDYKVLVVEDIYEITRNPEDLKSMMDRINDLVDLPAPFSPISPITVPRFTSRLILSRTLFRPKDLLIPRIDKTISSFLSAILLLLYLYCCYRVTYKDRSAPFFLLRKDD